MHIDLSALQVGVPEEGLYNSRVGLAHHPRGERVAEGMRCHFLIESGFGGVLDDPLHGARCELHGWRVAEKCVTVC